MFQRLEQNYKKQFLIPSFHLIYLYNYFINAYLIQFLEFSWFFKLQSKFAIKGKIRIKTAFP